VSSRTFLPCCKRSITEETLRRSMERVGAASFLMTKLLTSAGANDSPVRSLPSREIPFAPRKTRAWHSRNHNLEYIALLLRKDIAICWEEKLQRVRSPRSRPRGKVGLFVGATNVTANEPLLIANFGKFSLAVPPSFSKKIGTHPAHGDRLPLTN